MRYVLFFSFALILNISHAQVDLSKKGDSEFKISNFNIQANHFVENYYENASVETPLDRFSFNDYMSKNDSENESNKIVSLSTIEKQILKSNIDKSTNKPAKNLLWLVSNLALLDKIVSKQNKKNRVDDLILIDLSDTYGNHNLEIYSKLNSNNVDYNLTKDGTIQIGKNIIPFIQ